MTKLHLRTRRTVSILVTAVALCIAWTICWIQEASLGHSAYFSGASCLAALLLLVLIGVRRRIPVLNLGSVSMWTQFHIYTGLFATGVYVMHVPALLAGGTFEFGLSMLFWVVSISGFYGLYASRTLPKRLASIESEHRFDRMPWHRDQLAGIADGVLEDIEDPSAIRVLGAYYASYLKPFFVNRPSFSYVLVPTGGRRRRLLDGLKELDRYLEDEGRSTSGRFAFLVRKRDDLDYQFALQLRLRVWLVVHAVFSVMLVSGGIIHAIIAWRFTS